MIENFTLTQDGFFSQEECLAGIELFKRWDESGNSYTRQQADPNTPKTTMDDKSVILMDPRFVICHTHTRFFNVFIGRFWKAFDAYGEKYAVLTQYPKFHVYGGKLQKTEVGGGYHAWHAEDDSVENSRRKFAFILYLNDVDEGGETEFLYGAKRISPKAGRLVLFPSGMTHTHRGNPPLSGEKYIFTGWVEI